MSDLSAGRPLLYSKSDHEAFAAAVADALGPYVQVDEFNLASTLLDFLAAAGRLLPASSEHREEWAVKVHYPDWPEGREEFVVGDANYGAPERRAWSVVDWHRRNGAQVRVLRRKIFTGSWTEVDGSPTDG